MRFTYCVWYRVTDDGPDTERIVRGLMARLACRTGIAGQLMRKRDEPRLWMELYAGVVAPAPSNPPCASLPTPTTWTCS